MSLPQAQSNCSAAVAADRARVLIGCYRKGEAEDEAIYAGAVGAVLSGYSEAVARRVTDPRTGLPGASQWLPTVAEVRAACEREMAPVHEALRREAERARTARIVAPSAGVESAERRKRVVAEIRARLADLGSRPTASIDPRALSGQAKQDAFARLAERERELAAEWDANPPQFSPALRAILAEKD